MYLPNNKFPSINKDSHGKYFFNVEMGNKASKIIPQMYEVKKYRCPLILSPMNINLKNSFH